jgi:SOS-response transcriptional repressor LexA
MKDLTSLTHQEKKVLEACIKFQKVHGYAASLRDILKETGIKSTSTATYYLKSLSEKGFLTYNFNTPRSIVIL